MKIFKKHWSIFILVLVIFLTRLLIFNKDAAGYMADERHYQELINSLVESEGKNNYIIAAQKLTRLNARPALGLFYYPAAYLQWKNPSIPFGSYFNLVINSLFLILIYLIVKKTHNKKAAILATLLATFSISSIIYIRHLLPYDISLFILLLGFFVYIKTQKTFVFGLFAGLSFLTYVSYYYLLPIPLILMLYHRSFKPALSFIAGAVAILIFTNILFVTVDVDHRSYFESLKEESGGVTSVHQGDYISAFSFMGQYIFASDGIYNLILILIAFIFIIFQMKEKRISIIGVYIVLVFLIMEATAHILKVHVLYGRTVRPFYLGILIFTALVLEKWLNKLEKKVYLFLFCLIIFITFFNWLPRFITFKDALYPLQFKKYAREFVQSKYGDKAKIGEVLFVNYFGINSPPKMKIFKEFKDAEPGKFYIVNANVIYPYFGSYNLNLYCNSEVLLKVPHVQSQFRPYLFEGWGEVMREQSVKDPLYYQLIYCIGN